MRVVELFSVCQDLRDRLLDSGSDAGRHRDMDIARQKTDGWSSAHPPGAGNVAQAPRRARCRHRPTEAHQFRHRATSLSRRMRLLTPTAWFLHQPNPTDAIDARRPPLVNVLAAADHCTGPKASQQQDFSTETGRGPDRQGGDLGRQGPLLGLPFRHTLRRSPSAVGQPEELIADGCVRLGSTSKGSR